MANLMYKQERVFIATRHNKEQVIAPIFQQVFDVVPFVSSFINTDQFGTFTKEIERKDNPLDTLRKKCEYGYRLSGCPLVVASEGSFGTHPSIPFTNANEELVMFKDFNRSLEVTGRHLSAETNSFEKEIRSIDELQEILDKIQFPSHGIIVKDSKNNEVILKGVFDELNVIKFIRASLKSGQKLCISSDMRAVHNPTRMKAIQQATLNLAENINSLCPSCSSPGFVVVERKPGLPCKSCGMPTRSILRAIKTCQKCNEKVTIEHPNNKQFEDPMYCDFCNP